MASAYPKLDMQFDCAPENVLIPEISHMKSEPVMDTESDHDQFLDWQLNKSLPNCLEYMLLQCQFTDVAFVFPSEDPDSDLPAHKAILAARSPVMEAMFFGKMATTKEEVEIKEYSYVSFYEFLKFLYTDKIALTAKNASEVLRVSHYYRVPALTKECVSYLAKHLTANNVLEVLETSELLELVNLEKRAIVFIDSEATKVLQTDYFAELPHKRISKICKRSTLDTGEINVYSAAVRWAEAECLRQNIGVTGPNMRQVLGEDFQMLRMPCMNAEQFADKVVRDGLLTPEETLKIFMYFNASEKPVIDFIAMGPPRSFPHRALLCQKYEQEVKKLSQLEEQFTLSADADFVLLGFIFSKITTRYGVNAELSPLEIIEGNVTLLTNNDGPLFSQFSPSAISQDEDTHDVRLDEPLVVHSNTEYNVVLQALTENSSYTKDAFRTKMGRFPAGNVTVGDCHITLIQAGEKRRALSPIVGLLLVT